jgi:hypothetical protein
MRLETVIHTIGGAKSRSVVCGSKMTSEEIVKTCLLPGVFTIVVITFAFYEVRKMGLFFQVVYSWEAGGNFAPIFRV